MFDHVGSVAGEATYQEVQQLLTNNVSPSRLPDWRPPKMGLIAVAYRRDST
jgi:hypothetical protein